MVYIALSQPIKGSNIVRIKEIHIFDSDFEKAPEKITFGFRYQVCYLQDGKYIEEYDKFVTVDSVSELLQHSSSNFGHYDSLCKICLDYIVKKGLEQGTIEVK